MTDGVPVADDTDWSDNSAAMNVTHQAGDNSCIFTGLDTLTAYDFRIYPYANSGTFIDYKTDGTPPELSAITKDPILLEGFNTDALPAGWTTNVVEEGSGAGNPADGGIRFVTDSTSPSASPSEGTHFVKWYSFLVKDGAEVRLESPSIDATSNRNITVCFQWFESDNYSTYTNEGVTVQWSDNGTTWNDVEFFQRVGPADEWKLKSCQLPSEANGKATLYIGLKFHSQYGYNCYLDDFKVCGDISAIVTTQDVTNIGTTTATGNGNITDLGVPNPTAHGVCWSTSANPTTSDSYTDEGAASSTGAFTSDMAGLSPGTTYYVRAYATNTAGTAYGADVSFTTGFPPPDVTGITPDHGNRG